MLTNVYVQFPSQTGNDHQQSYQPRIWRAMFVRGCFAGHTKLAEFRNCIDAVAVAENDISLNLHVDFGHRTQTELRQELDRIQHLFPGAKYVDTFTRNEQTPSWIKLNPKPAKVIPFRQIA